MIVIQELYGAAASQCSRRSLWADVCRPDQQHESGSCLHCHTAEGYGRCPKSLHSIKTFVFQWAIGSHVLEQWGEKQPRMSYD